MKLFRVAVMFFVGVGLAAPYHIGRVGFSEVTTNGETEMWVGSDPVLIAWAAIAIVLFAVLLRLGRRKTVVTTGIATLKRRAAALLIDFWFGLATLSSITALVPLSLEATRTGHFLWHFERDYTVATDSLLLPLVLLVMAVMFLYFAFPLTKGSQTVGCFIMRLKVTPPFGDEGCFIFREALRRTGYALWGLMTWKWATKGFRDGQGRTWWDRETDSRVVLVQYE